MILFLDFDGVLHPATPQENELFQRRHLLWRLLDACPEVDVVFSTSWRDLHPVDELIAFVTAGGGERLAGRFVGTTPVRVAEPGAAIGQIYKRETEIRMWLAGNGEQSRPWIAIDDFAAYFSPGCPNLVLIEDHNAGMSDADADRIREYCDSAETARVLTAYANGELSRSETMRAFGFAWYGQLLDVMAAANIARPSVPKHERAVMVAHAQKTLGGAIPTKIVSDPGILGGVPIVEGTRVPAANVLAEISAGKSKCDIYESYPTLPLDGAEACILWDRAQYPK